MTRLIVSIWLSRLIRLVLGVLFLWASITKIVTPADFLSSIYNYQLLSPPLAMVLAVVLPWVEFLIGVFLLGGVCLPGALIVCMGMCAVFVFAHASVLYRGMSIDCGCGLVPGDEHVTYLTLARSLLLLFSTIVAYRCVRFVQKSESAANAAAVESVSPAV